MSAEELIYEKKDGVGWIRINRPELFNTLDRDGWDRLGDLLIAAGRDKSVGVVVLTGTGEKSFCAGGYLADLTSFDTQQARDLYESGYRALTAMRRIPQPVIAAVNGVAIGGGNEIVVCADLAIASEHARFGQAGPRVGSAPIWGGSNLQSITLGEKKAREVAYLCRQYKAQEALEMGWINKVVPHDQLIATVQEWCEELLDKSPAYLEVTKISSNIWWEMLAPSIEMGRLAMIRLAGGEEMTEGASAFMAKRKADFRQFRNGAE